MKQDLLEKLTSLQTFFYICCIIPKNYINYNYINFILIFNVSMLSLANILTYMPF